MLALEELDPLTSLEQMPRSKTSFEPSHTLAFYFVLPFHVWQKNQGQKREYFKW